MRTSQNTTKPAALLLALCFGCAGTVRQTAKEAAPGAVEGAIQSAHHPENREDVAEILADPRIRAATSALASSMVGGALDALTDEERQQRLEAAANGLIERVGAGVVRQMSDELRPQIAAIVAESAERAVQQVLSQKTEERATEFTLAMSRAVVRGLAEELRANDPKALGDGVSLVARRASQGFALGVQDAVDRSTARQDAGNAPHGETLAAVGRAAKTGFDLLSWRGMILSLLGLGLLGGLVAAIVAALRYRRASAARAEALRSLLQAHPELAREAHAHPELARAAHAQP
jgi:hypothetical protein